MRKILLFLGLIILLSGCGPTIRDSRIIIQIPPNMVTSVDADGKAIPMQINIANKTVAIDTARGANIPVSMIPGIQ
jgi:hypothetical protein